MKKLLNLILALVSVAVLALIVLLEVNTIYAVVEIPQNFATVVDYAVKFGPLALIALNAMLFFSGKGVIRVLLLLITITIVAVGVIAFGFPDLIANLLT